MNKMELQLEALMRLCAAEREEDRIQAKAEVKRLLVYCQADAADPEALIRGILLELGAPDHLVGHPYMVEAILLVLRDRTYINRITSALYPYLAVKFGTTAARVERALRHLIEVTWSRGDYEVLCRYFGNTVSASKGKPTNGEFIARIANVVRQQVKPAA